MNNVKQLSPQPRRPAQFLSLLDGKPYTVAAKTNIRETFRRLGWVGPEEQKEAAKIQANEKAQPNNIIFNKKFAKG